MSVQTFNEATTLIPAKLAKIRAEILVEEIYAEFSEQCEEADEDKSIRKSPCITEIASSFLEGENPDVVKKVHAELQRILLK